MASGRSGSPEAPGRGPWQKALSGLAVSHQVKSMQSHGREVNASRFAAPGYRDITDRQLPDANRVLGAAGAPGLIRVPAPGER